MNNARSHYIKYFKNGFNEYKASTNGDASSEITVLIGKPNENNDLFRTNVFDAISKNEDGKIDICEFNTDPIPVIYENTNVTDKICWNGIEFKCVKTSDLIESLIQWANLWINDAHPRKGEQDGLAGIIHSVTFPETDGDYCTFSVDFGSAPIDALDELVQTLGNNLIEIGSYSMSRDA